MQIQLTWPIINYFSGQSYNRYHSKYCTCISIHTIIPCYHPHSIIAAFDTTMTDLTEVSPLSHYSVTLYFEQHWRFIAVSFVMGLSEPAIMFAYNKVCFGWMFILGTTLNLLKFPIVNPKPALLHRRIERLEKEKSACDEEEKLRRNALKVSGHWEHATLMGQFILYYEILKHIQTFVCVSFYQW